MSEYIERHAAIDALAKAMPALTTPDGSGESDHDIQVTDEAFIDAMQVIHEVKPAAVLPYSIEPDGTLTITVPKGTTVSRVLVQEDGTQWGGLFYND